jgi:hypothetical protein
MAGNPDVLDRVSAVERFTGPIASKSEQLDARRPHKSAYNFTANFAADALMLEICFMSGEFLAFDATSSPTIAYVPGTILILYPTAIVEIEGRHLAVLVTYLKQRRISYIQEAHDDHAPESETYIEAINLHDPARWEEMIAALCPRMQKFKAR